MGLYHYCLCISSCVQREIAIGAWMDHSCKNLRSGIFGCTYLVTSAMLGSSFGIPLKCEIFVSKQRHSFCVQASSCCLHPSIFLSNLINRQVYGLAGMDWDGSYFLLKMWVSWFPITIYLENLSTSTLKSNRIIVRRTMDKTWRGWCEKKECRIK